jgi:hypothetical protein
MSSADTKTGTPPESTAATNGGFRPTRPNNPAAGPLIAVQPPRREDLQPSYAQMLPAQSEDAGTHGWYGSMSTYISSK